jgi:SPP1 gp7 family putative phage head morphogenesis protein
VFDGELNGIDIPTTLENAQTFMKGVFEGYGGNFSSYAYDTPDFEKLLHLERNVYQFSGAKNWQMCRDITDLVKTTKTFHEFKKQATPIINEYQGSWLRTEYNAAVAGSQMASKWVDFEKHPDALLEYRTMEDIRVRPEHAALDKITRPVNDPFWSRYYPPNGWNCRCTVIRLNSGKRTPDSKMEYPDIPKAFDTNLAKTGMVFPKSSPIFVNCPPEILKKSENLIEEKNEKNS